MSNCVITVKNCTPQDKLSVRQFFTDLINTHSRKTAIEVCNSVNKKFFLIVVERKVWVYTNGCSFEFVKEYSLTELSESIQRRTNMFEYHIVDLDKLVWSTYGASP